MGEYEQLRNYMKRYDGKSTKKLKNRIKRNKIEHKKNR